MFANIYGKYAVNVGELFVMWKFIDFFKSVTRTLLHTEKLVRSANPLFYELCEMA